MSVFLTSTGFQQKTLVDIRTELEAAYRSVFGDTVDLSPEGPLGQIIALNAKMLADLWEGASEIYTSRDPDQATGEALDNICAETGVERLAATQARADSVLCWCPLQSAVTIPSGSKIKPASGNSTYSLESTVTTSANTALARVAFRIKISIVDGETMGITIGGVAYSSVYNQATYGTIQNFVDTSFAPVVLAGIPGAVCKYTKINGVEYVEFVFPSAKTMSTGYGLLYPFDAVQGVYGNFVSDVPGAATVPALTLDTISTPIAGWLGVTQYAQGIDGTDTETDTALRLRRVRSLRSGTATEDALYTAILRVPNVSYASVTSNRTLATDSEGRPGKSVECVVQGGEKQAIASAIWKTAPAGIELYGATFAPEDIPFAVGADGLQHPVNFSTPQPVYVHIRVTIEERNSEDPTPDNLIQSVKDAILAWTSTNMGLGTNSVLQKYCIPVYSVPSIQLVSLEHAITPEYDSTVPWNTASYLPISAREYGSFAADHIEVVIV